MAAYTSAGMTKAAFPILFIAPSRIGDAVLASGLVKVLVEHVPRARFTFVGSELTAPLFAETPGVERVIVMEKRPLAGHWFNLWLICSSRDQLGIPGVQRYLQTAAGDY